MMPSARLARWRASRFARRMTDFFFERFDKENTVLTGLRCMDRMLLTLI